jgi:carboxyl-terminal processing protease
MYDKSIAYIRLNHFLKNSSKQFKQKLDSLVSQNKIEKLIIDLRQNTGGMVDECITTLGYFLPANTQVCYLKGFNKESNYSYFTSNVDGDTTLPISILISNKTISAGEIFAGALQDLDRAELIGERTFGKGYVQGTRYPGMGTSLYVTAARYFTPSGRCIQERKYAFDVTTSNFTDTTNIFYTKKGKIVKANGGVEPDIIFKNEMELNLNQIFTEKEMFFYLNSLYEKYTNTIDTLNFLEAESKKLMKYLSKNLNLIKHPADDELKLFEERLSNKLDASIYKNEIRIIQQKINKKKIELLKKYEKQIKFELQAQFIKRKYGKAQEELFRIQNDLILKQVKN